MSQTLDSLSDGRRDILIALKGSGPLPILDLSERLGVTGEAVRQQLGQLEREGWVKRWVDRRGSGGPGRPRRLYELTLEGDHLFPKHYDDLAVELVDTVAETLGATAVKQILAAFTETRVKKWRPALEGLSLEQKLTALEGLYMKDDPFIRVERTADGEFRLVERNCPFLNVARRRPALCSVTVSTLSNLLGYRVVREKRFQHGDGCCAFRVRTEQPLDPTAPVFEWEEGE